MSRHEISVLESLATMERNLAEQEEERGEQRETVGEVRGLLWAIVGVAAAVTGVACVWAWCKIKNVSSLQSKRKRESNQPNYTFREWTS